MSRNGRSSPAECRTRRIRNYTFAIHVSPSTEDDGSSGFQKELPFDIGTSTLNNPKSYLRPKLFLWYILTCIIQVGLYELGNCGTHVCKRYNFELFTQGFLSSVKRVIVAFKVGDLGIFVCTRTVVSYMVSFFHSRLVIRVTFQSLGMSVFWVKNESVWSVMTTCNGI